MRKGLVLRTETGPKGEYVPASPGRRPTRIHLIPTGSAAPVIANATIASDQFA